MPDWGTPHRRLLNQKKISNYSESRWHDELFDLSDLLSRRSKPDAPAVWGRNNPHRQESHSDNSYQHSDLARH